MRLFWTCLLSVCCSHLAFVDAVMAQPVDRAGRISGSIVSTKGGEQANLVPRKTWRRAVVRQKLKAGDVLRTNRSGTLAIVFADRTQVRLGRNSTLVVREVRNGTPSQLRLRRGKIWGRSPRGQSNLSVETPSATAAIRGTEWAIQADEDSSQLQVFSGSVELTNELGRLLVGTGQAARAERGIAPVRVNLVNPVGREQMLYFVDLADGLDLMGADNPVVQQARQNLAIEDWQAAKRDFTSLANSTDLSEQAMGAYGLYVAAVKSGEIPEQPRLKNSSEGDLALILMAAYDGDLRKGLEFADEALRAFRQTPEIHVAKARVEVLLGEPGKAMKTLSSALDIFPDSDRLIVAKSDWLREYGGQPKAARDLVKLVVANHPDNILARKSAIKNWMAIGGTSEAAAILTPASVQRPMDSELLALQAQLLLAENKLDAAKMVIDQALERDGVNPLIYKSLSAYWARKDKLKIALDTSLTASAINPDFGLGFLTLAQIQYDLGEGDLAFQQLDVAERLDPNSPAIPLARTAIALHRFAADDAIVNARKSLQSYRARGGEYFNLSENRETGSLVSQAFRFLDLEGWGRYYADRVFDSFTPSSYFDQALNQTPGPFLIRNFDGSFNAQQSQNFDTVSSFLQGLALEPLSVASSDRRLRFDNGNFFEAGIGGFYFNEDLRNVRQILGGVDAIVDQPIPIAVNIDARYSDSGDRRRRPDLDPFSRRQGSDDWQIQGFAGAELTSSDNIVITGEYSDQSADSETNILTQIDDRFELRERVERENRFLFGLWSHEFGYRDILTVAGGLGGEDRSISSLDVSSANQTPDTLSSTNSKFHYLSVNYAKGFGSLDLRLGAEYSDASIRASSSRFDFGDPAIAAISNGNPFVTTISEYRAHADLRYQASENLVLQGQLEYVSGELASSQAGNPNIPGPDQFSRLNWRIGISYEPVEGQWLRVANLRENNGLFDFSFRPVAVVGLQPNTAPNFRLSRSDSTIVRWDAEWSNRFFTSVEFQTQEHESVRYFIPDLPIDVFGNPVTIDRVNIEANYWMGHNIGLRASYAYTNSNIAGMFITGANANQAIGPAFGCSTDDGPFSNLCRFEQGDQLPFVPGHFARGSVIWSLPAPTRLRLSLAGSYIGDQTGDLGTAVDDALIFDLRINWQALDRRVIFDLALLNLFDAQYDSTTAVAAPRFTVLAGVGFRF